MNFYFIYMLSNSNNTVLYTGVTNDLLRRVYEHKNHMDPKSFTSKYNVEKLIYYEYCNNPESAIQREKQIKGWNRKRKEKLIHSMNPEWKDLYDKILEET